MDKDRHGGVRAAGPTVGLLEAAGRIFDSTLTAPRGTTAQKLHRAASLLAAFATVYLVDRNGRPLRPLRSAELYGAVVGPGGALEYSDGRPALGDVALLESSLDELREHLARLGILGSAGD